MNKNKQLLIKNIINEIPFNEQVLVSLLSCAQDFLKSVVDDKKLKNSVYESSLFEETISETNIYLSCLKMEGGELVKRNYELNLSIMEKIKQVKHYNSLSIIEKSKKYLKSDGNKQIFFPLFNTCVSTKSFWEKITTDITEIGLLNDGELKVYDDNIKKLIENGSSLKEIVVDIFKIGDRKSIKNFLNNNYLKKEDVDLYLNNELSEDLNKELFEYIFKYKKDYFESIFNGEKVLVWQSFLSFCNNQDLLINLIEKHEKENFLNYSQLLSITYELTNLNSSEKNFIYRLKGLNYFLKSIVSDNKDISEIDKHFLDQIMEYFEKNKIFLEVYNELSEVIGNQHNDFNDSVLFKELIIDFKKNIKNLKSKQDRLLGIFNKFEYLNDVLFIKDKNGNFQLKEENPIYIEKVENKEYLEFKINYRDDISDKYWYELISNLILYDKIPLNIIKNNEGKLLFQNDKTDKHLEDHIKFILNEIVIMVREYLTEELKIIKEHYETNKKVENLNSLILWYKKGLKNSTLISVDVNQEIINMWKEKKYSYLIKEKQNIKIKRKL